MKAPKALTLCLFIPAALALIAATAWAAPLLDITNGPITPDESYTGPSFDQHAAQGQWFQNLDANGNPVANDFEVREYEFYDNLYQHGGSQSTGEFKGSTDAIEGIVTTYATNAPGDIISFTIKTTITNDTPGSGDFNEGDNSHGEELKNAAALSFDMYGVKLTADFAMLNDATKPNEWTGPYREVTPEIYAVHPDQVAWYCYAHDSEAPKPLGGSYVPAYDFGNIPVGASATRDLSFTVGPPDGSNGLTPTQGRGLAIVESEAQGKDIFLNRSTSLKISDWVDDLLLDPGTDYPAPPLRSSDVSVFCTIPEPGELAALAGMCLMGLLGYRRRRRRTA